MRGISHRPRFRPLDVRVRCRSSLHVCLRRILRRYAFNTMRGVRRPLTLVSWTRVRVASFVGGQEDDCAQYSRVELEVVSVTDGNQ
jgi:hypothetical protein